MTYLFHCCIFIDRLHIELEKALTKTTASSEICAGAGIEPSEKKQRTSLFGHYKSKITVVTIDTAVKTAQRQLTRYIETINDCDFCLQEPIEVFISKSGLELQSLFSRVFCVPASSAPVERVFSQIGLIMRPNRARMSDALLESLVFLKCNADNQ